MNDHNRGNTVTGCKFVEAGDSAICFVGLLESTVDTPRDASASIVLLTAVPGGAIILPAKGNHLPTLANPKR
jgi:hypothetical protein